MNTALITKIVGVFLFLLFGYYVFMFFRYRRKYGSNNIAVKRTVFLVLPLVICLLIVEIVCRTIVAQKTMRRQAHVLTRYCAMAYYIKSLRLDHYKPRYVRLREDKPNENWKRDFNALDADTVYHCELKTDNDGFVLPECCGVNPTIFFMGGSTTENLVVSPEKRFPYLVAKELQKNGMVYTVKNSGVSGNNTFNNINILINKVLAYKPVAVVYMEAINDLTTLVFEAKYHNDNPFRSLVIDENKREPEVHDDDEFHAKAGYQKVVDTVVLLNDYKKALKIFIGICRGADVKIILMTQPNRIDSSNISNCKSLQFMIKRYADNFPKVNPINLYKQMNNAVRQVATEQNVPLIDLDIMVPKTGKYMFDVVHLVDEGSEFVTPIITSKLTEVLSVSTGAQSLQ